MVLSGLLQSIRRLVGQEREVIQSSCSSGSSFFCDMEAREEEQPIEAQTQHPSVVFSPTGPLLVERGGDRGMDRGSLVAGPVASAQSASSRTISIKRKLEELEMEAVESSAAAVSQVRPRREAREDIREGIIAESSGRERRYGDTFNPEEAQPLDDESQMREEGGNAANDVDAMWDNEILWTGSVDEISEARPIRMNADDEGDSILNVSEIDSYENNLSMAVADRLLGNSIIDYGSPSNSGLGLASESASVLTSEHAWVTETGELLRSATGNHLDIVRESELVGEDNEVGCPRMSEQEIENEFGSRNFGNRGELLGADLSCNMSGSVCGAIANGIISGESCLCDVSIGSVGNEASVSSNGSNSQPRLQFFVRTYLDCRTIVLHANESDTIESVHRQILSRTGLPISEQRLIYFGRQLQQDQTLTDCRVCNDATLYLVARMRSTALPLSWQLMNEIVATIRQICALGDYGGHVHLAQAQERIRSGVKEFLKMAAKPGRIPEHMQVFQLAGATSALVMLLLSPVEWNPECAEESIKLFLHANDDFLPDHIHNYCASVLLDFCKLLAKSAPTHCLYSECRNALACLLGKIGVAERSKYFIDAKDESFVHDFAPFVSELSSGLSSHLRWTARTPPSKETFVEFHFYAKDGQDFTSFVIHLCNAMELCKGVELAGLSSNLRFTKARSFGGLEQDIEYARVSNRDDLCRDSMVAVDGVTDTRVEIGTHRWLRSVFRELFHEIDVCLAAVEQVGDIPCDMCGPVAADDRPFGWAPFLIILKGLHAIAELYEDDMDDLMAMLHARRLALNMLVSQSRWQDDHSWLLGHKFLLDFEPKRKLVMVMLPEPQEDHEERQEIVVHRSQILSESFDLLAYVEPDILQGGLSVEFATEEATGPGVLREWFSLICREIFNPQNALFLACPNDQRRYFPNPASGVNPGHLMYFRFCGRVIALALMHRVQIDAVLSLAFFKQLAGLPVSWEDSKDADPCLYESCKKILDMDAEFVDSDALGLTFVSEVEEFGTRKAMELCSGGKEILVTSRNRLQYVELLVQRRFVRSVAEQVKSFSQGFSDLLIKANHQQFFQALDHEELDLMLYGKDRNIALDDWKAHTEYHDYSCSDDQIVWFWQVVEGMSMEQRRRLLFFSTSVTHLPAEGFAGLCSKFHIHRAQTDISWLPTAHTCFYQLVLPPYPSFEIIQARLLAVTEDYIVEGFGFA